MLNRISARSLPSVNGQVRTLLIVLAVAITSALPRSFAQDQTASGTSTRKPTTRATDVAAAASPVRPKDRPASLAATVARLKLGEGSVIADIGAGGGRDTWVFARIVGPSGRVYAEEITDSSVKSLQAEAQRRRLPQVRAILGRSETPNLPNDSVDLAYMRSVYHHFAKPREMLRAIRQSLKPGGYLVVVDERRGTLRDWVTRDLREQRHFLIAETTVVREAREEGFLFVDCPDDLCEAAAPFVLVFQRPRGTEAPPGDPDPFLSLDVEQTARLLSPLGGKYERPVFIALGQARNLIPPCLKASRTPGVEIVLEEWATRKDERPPLPDGISLPAVLTEQGDPHLGPEAIDVVFFLDSYHLLFHGKTLLSKLHERLLPGGCVYVLDRESTTSLSRREASHRRKIEPAVVKREMVAAGFHFWREGPRPAPDRFLLVFGKNAAAQVNPRTD